MQRRIGWLSGAVAGLALLAACAEKEVILPGERHSVREDLNLVGTAGAAAETSRAISLPGMQNNADWAQRGGNARHAAPHAALSANPSLAWATAIGQGSSRKVRLTAAPVVAGGRVFAMDAAANLSAVSTGGGLLWQASLAPGFDRSGGLPGGGLAAEGGKIFATTGYGEVVAVDAASGGILWRQRVDSPVEGAPAVSDGVVYVVSRDGGAWALDAGSGRVVWQVAGTPGVAGMGGTAAPTVGDRAVYFPLASGEVMAVLKIGAGTKVWAQSVAGRRLGRAYATTFDLTGDAALIGETLYTGNAAGRTSALDAGSGEVKWNAVEGAMGPLAIGGGAIFLVNDEAQLVRLDQASGQVIWAVDMPYYAAEKVKKRKAITAHYGPVLAGGKVWVAGSDGVLRGFSAQSGALAAQTEIPGGAATQPAVAGGALYVVSTNGQLLAFR